MEFEWDAVKAAFNLEKLGVGFAASPPHRRAGGQANRAEKI
jgi:uncharacterized DUF497 family protein